MLGFLLGFLLLLNLGTRGLNEPDEARYSNIARAMLAEPRDWWIPRMSDFGHFDKPPLIYWATAFSIRFLGDTEAAARMPSVLGAVLALVGIGWVAFRLHGPRPAWWNVLFCATLGQFFVLSRMLTPDMFLTGWITLAAGFWAEARYRGASGYWWWGTVVCASLAWWTKATAALVPLAGLVLGLWVTGDRQGWRALRPVRLLLLVLIAGAPWYLDLMLRYPELREFFLGRELAGRIVGHPDGRHGPIYYHVGFSLVGWLPWWPAALVVAFWGRHRLWKSLQMSRARAVPLEGWVVLTGFTVFSLMSSKLVTYTLPLAPWAALWSVRALLGVGPEFTPAVSPLLVRRLALGFMGLYVVAGFVMPHVETRLGVGSSDRRVGQFLRERGAGTVYSDRYFPGLEHYFGERVYYVQDNPPRQLPSDPGICPSLGEPHFVSAVRAQERLLQGVHSDVWLIRYRGKSSSYLSKVLPALESVEEVRLGDFVLNHVVPRPTHHAQR